MESPGNEEEREMTDLCIWSAPQLEMSLGNLQLRVRRRVRIIDLTVRLAWLGYLGRACLWSWGLRQRNRVREEGCGRRDYAVPGDGSVTT